MKRPSRPYFYIMLISLLGIAGVVAIRNTDAVRTAARDGVAMDTVVRISVNAGKSAKSKQDLDEILDGAFRLLGDLERAFSMYEASSDIVKLAANAGGAPVPVAPDLYSLMLAAVDLADISNGAYDPTIGAVTALWQDKDGARRLPPEAALKRALALVDYRRIKLDAPNLVQLEKKGMKLDLGGIGKGYASQALADFFKSRGIGSALIDLGGNVVAMGGRPDGGAWRIGIQDPRKGRGSPMCVLEVRGACVITAGVYERTWEIDGVNYTHILDPATGMPIAGPMVSATVICDDPTAGDALSTAFMVMGRERAIDLLHILPGVDAVFVSETEDGGIEAVATSGLRGMLKLLNRDYRLSYVEIR